jgi:hypothetical protein
MKEMTARRRHFPRSARAKPSRFWHRLSALDLSHQFLTAGRRSAIHQALGRFGYLPAKKLCHHHVETTSAHHPLCLELIDAEECLRKYLQQHADQLRHVQAVLVRCELSI